MRTIRQMGTKLLRRLSVAGLLGFLALSVIAGAFWTEVTLHPGRHLQSSGEEMVARKMAQWHDSELTDIAVAARDGVTLRAWTMRPRNNNGNAVILLHGLADNRLGMTGYAELLLSRGFSVLLPDARAHGTSGGNLATFGLLEAEDIHRWFDWLEQNQHPKCIFGLGESLGAAQLLQSLQSETRFCAVAAESPFATFREIAYDRVGQFFHTGLWLGHTLFRPTVESAFVYARWKYKLNFEQLSPEGVAARTSVPVLLIHGQSDSNIPVRHSRLIAGRNRAVLLWEVPNTDHCGAIGTSPDEFAEKLIGWFDSNTSAQNHLVVRGAR